VSKKEKPKAEHVQAVELSGSMLVRYIEDDAERAKDETAAKDSLPAKVVAQLDELTAKPDSYRDSLLLLLAIPTVRGERVDLRERAPGWRAATRAVGKVLRGLHIKGVNEAFENIAKNSPQLVRGNNDAFDSLLIWASDEADVDEIRSALAYVASKVAATARNTAPRPQLRLARLRFAEVMGVLDAMLDTPSGGAHEQYIVAALLQAAYEQEGSGRRVETKGLSASDASSKTAGDVQVFHGRLEAGIEVSANPWQEKLAQAEQTIRDYEVRSFIVAKMEPGAWAELAGATDRDIAALDVRAVVQVLVAALDRNSREAALLRLYELLDQRLADPALVNAYVGRLRDAGLTEDVK
jgi:hypothetical protein